MLPNGTKLIPREIHQLLFRTYDRKVHSFLTNEALLHPSQFHTLEYPISHVVSQGSKRNRSREERSSSRIIVSIAVGSYFHRLWTREDRYTPRHLAIEVKFRSFSNVNRGSRYCSIRRVTHRGVQFQSWPWPVANPVGDVTSATCFSTFFVVGIFFFCFERGMLSPCALFTFVWNDLIDKSAYVDISMEFITWEISRGNMVVKWCTFFCFCERKEGFYKRGGPNILFFF